MNKFAAAMVAFSTSAMALRFAEHKEAELAQTKTQQPTAEEFADFADTISGAVADDIMSNMEDLYYCEEIEECLMTVVHDSIVDTAVDYYGEYAYYYEDEIEDLAGAMTDCFIALEEYYGMPDYETMREDLAEAAYGCAMMAFAYYEYDEYYYGDSYDYYDYDYYGYYDSYYMMAYSVADDIMANMEDLYYCDPVEPCLEPIVFQSIMDFAVDYYGEYDAYYYGEMIEMLAAGMTDCFIALEEYYGMPDYETMREDLAEAAYGCAMDTWDDYYYGYYGYFAEVEAKFGEYEDEAWFVAYGIADDIMANMDELEACGDIDECVLATLEDVVATSIMDTATAYYGEYAYYYEDDIADLAAGLTDCFIALEEEYGMPDYETMREDLAEAAFGCGMIYFYGEDYYGSLAETQYYDYCSYYDEAMFVAYGIADDIMANLEDLYYCDPVEPCLEPVVFQSIMDTAVDYYGEYAYYYEDEIADLADSLTDCFIAMEEEYGMPDYETMREDLASAGLMCAMEYFGIGEDDC